MIGAVAGLSLSCNQDDIAPDTPDVSGTLVGEYAKVRFTTADGNADKASTRAVWTDYYGSSNLLFSWEAYPEDGAGLVAAISNGTSFLSNYTSETPATDEVPAYASYLAVEPVADEEDNYPNKAKFETKKCYNTSEVSQAKYVYAVAPFGESAYSGQTDQLSATAEMPCEFSQTASQDPSFLRDYMFMCGSAEMTDGSASIDFEHIPATFRFIVTNGRPYNALITSVKMSREDGGNIGSTQPDLSVKPADTKVSKTYTSPCTAITTNIITDEEANLSSGSRYITYAMALPVGDGSGVYDNNAFKDKKIQFTIATFDNYSFNEYLSFVLDGALIEGANRTFAGNGVYNWVGGKSYTFRLSLSDVLSLDEITVADWAESDVDGGVAEEVVTE